MPVPPRLAVALLLAPCVASAQRVLGLGDDAVPVPRGVLRVGARVQFANWDALLVDGRRVAAGAPFSRDSLLARDLAALGDAAAPLATLSGRAPTISLGSLRVDQRARRVTVPFGVELGATSRLTLAVRGAFVAVETERSFGINDDVSAATFGLNPALTNPAAQARNAALLGQLAEATSALDQRIAFCAMTPTAPGCTTVNAEAAQARALVRDASAWRGAAATLYRDGLYAPRAGSDAQAAVEGRLAELRAGFVRYGVAALSPDAAPAAAAPLGAADFDRLLTEDRFGLRYRAARRSYAQSYGDVEVAARFVVLDAIDTARPRGVRIAVGAAYRGLPFALDDPDDLFDVPQGAVAASWRGEVVADARLHRAVWASLTATHQRFDATTVSGLRAGAPTQLFVPADPRIGGRLTPGAVTALGVTPRWELGGSFAFGGGYAAVWRRADTFAPAAGPAAVLARASRAEAWTVGFAYSTLGAWLERRARLPVDVAWSRSGVLRGAGAPVDAAVTDVVALRVYYRR